MTDIPDNKPAVSTETAKLSPTWEMVGIDFSRWQREIDWSLALSQSISFAFIKSSEGTQVIDSQFERNMQETARLGIPRGIYHYFKADKDWKKQADHFASVINAWDFELEPVMDLESDAGLTKNDLNNVCAKWIPRLEAATGREIMIYTSPGFFDSQLPLTNWAWRKPLWVAHWTKATQPRLPLEWSNHKKTWLYWQHSSDKNGLGSQYGVATKNIDLNRFNGTRLQFMQRYKLTSLPSPIEPPSPPLPEPPPTEIPAPQFVVLPRALHVRSGPGIRYPILRDIHAGDAITALNVSAPRECWVQIAEDQWCALAYNSYQFLRKT
jgi:lysozyme